MNNQRPAPKYATLSDRRTPVWAERSTRIASAIVALTLGVCVMLAAIGFAERCSANDIRLQEHLVASDMIESVDRILRQIQSSQTQNLRRLPGQHCETVARQLAELKAYIRYVRDVALVSGERVYCSSVMASMNIPLSAYFSATQHDVGMDLIRGTPFQPTVPVLTAFHAISPTTGLLYVIDAPYIAHILAHGLRYGAGKLTLSVAGSGTIDADDIFSADSLETSGSGTRVASVEFPISVNVTASDHFISQVRWKYGLISAAASVLSELLIAATYLLVLAPRRLLLAAVWQGIRSGQFHVVYQPVVEIPTRNIAGVEALIRWTHPRWGTVSPASFMGEVESSDLLGDVTRFVLRRATTEVEPPPGRHPIPHRSQCGADGS
jgi:sensor c-di-GMP phosphodiesterase-like protein